MHAASLLIDSLEPELRAQGYSQIIVSAVVEVNVIPHFRADADRPSERLESTAWVYCKIRRPIGQADSIGEARRRILVADTEVVESDLAGNENAEWS